MKYEFKVEGMMCEGCKNNVISTLSKIDGVSAVNVDLKTKITIVETTKDIDESTFDSAIKKAGFKYIK